MSTSAITDKEFAQFRELIYKLAGISMAPSKSPLIAGRLAKRLKHHHLRTYGEYFHLLMAGEHPNELQIAIDLLTTNETHFFREPKHFDFMRDKILSENPIGRPLRVWSAACSSGQEPYSISMTLMRYMKNQSWEIFASDISLTVLEKAKSGHYPMEQAKEIPPEYLSSYCLKGIGSQVNTFLMDRKLRNSISFMQINLNESLPQLPEFDLVFLRNVMIYFNSETKRNVVRSIMSKMRSGAYLFIGHSESLNGINNELIAVAPAIYRKA